MKRLQFIKSKHFSIEYDYDSFVIGGIPDASNIVPTLRENATIKSDF